MSKADNDLLKVLAPLVDAGRLEWEPLCQKYFDLLNNEFPIGGFGIKWDKMRNVVRDLEEDHANQTPRGIDFFRMICLTHNLNGVSATYFGDEITQAAITGKMEDLEEALPALLEVPQHHYFLSKDLSWCLYYSFEGDMLFGYR